MYYVHGGKLVAVDANSVDDLGGEAWVATGACAERIDEELAEKRRRQPNVAEAAAELNSSSEIGSLKLGFEQRPTNRPHVPEFPSRQRFDPRYINIANIYNDVHIAIVCQGPLSSTYDF